MSNNIDAEPNTAGWYGYSGGANVLIFLLDEHGQWWAATSSGTMDKCVWGYIEQALSVWELVLLAPLGGN